MFFSSIPQRSYLYLCLALGLMGFSSPSQALDLCGNNADDCEDVAIDNTFPLRDVTANGMTFKVRYGGPPSGVPANGETVLLLHGYPETSYVWKHQLKALANAGYRVIAPNQRGYSPGARPDVPSWPLPNPYRLSELASDALAIATTLGAPKFHMVGHDWGGVVAWHIAQTQPSRVISMSSVSTPHPGAMRADLAIAGSCQNLKSIYFDVMQFPGIENLLLAGEHDNLFCTVYATLPDDAACVYFNTLNTTSALNAATEWYSANINAVRQMTTALDTPVSRPSMLIFGTADEFYCLETADDSRWYMAPTPTSVFPYFSLNPLRREYILGAGHWLPEKNAARVTELLLSHISSYH